MALNLELKLRVESFNKLRNILEQIGAEYKGIFKQRDVYFKVQNALLKLRIMDSKSELIRYNRNEDGGTRWSDYSILTINDSKAEDFFRRILSVETMVTKQRELWMYDNTRIHLDSVKNLGSFLELETLVKSNKKDTQKRFAKVIDLLGLDKNEELLMSYRDLLLEKGLK